MSTHWPYPSRGTLVRRFSHGKQRYNSRHSGLTFRATHGQERTRETLTATSQGPMCWTWSPSIPHPSRTHRKSPRLFAYTDRFWRHSPTTRSRFPPSGSQPTSSNSSSHSRMTLARTDGSHCLFHDPSTPLAPHLGSHLPFTMHSLRERARIASCRAGESSWRLCSLECLTTRGDTLPG